MSQLTRKKARLEEYIPSDFARTWIISKDTGRRGTHVPKAFVDICGGYESDAKIFAQIMYWHMPNEDYESRLTQFAEDCWWLAKNHADWFAETRTKQVTARKCIDRLRDQHYLIFVLHGGFAGSPVPLYRINWQEFERRMRRWSELQGEAITEKAYPAFLEKLATPPDLAAFYRRQQQAYKALSGKVLSPAPSPATEYPTSGIKYHTLDLKDQPPLIRQIRPLIRRIISNTETTQKTTFQRLHTYYVGDERRAPTLKLTFHARLIQVKAKSASRAASSVSKSAEQVATAVAPPPVPPPPSPPPTAAPSSPPEPAARDPHIVTGGDIPPNQHDQMPIPPNYRNFAASLTAQQAVEQLKQHPIWKAYAAAFPQNAQPDIERWEVEGVEVALNTLDRLQVTPQEVTDTMAAWLPQRKKTSKPHRFIYLPGDVRNYRQMQASSGGGRATSPTPDELASDELATVEGCQRIIEDPHRPDYARKVAQEQLLRLTQPPVPEDYWPAPEAGESESAYETRRAELWESIWMSGFGDQYIASERPLLRAEAVS